MAVKFKDTININGQYTLPSTDGSVGQVLVTDGLGNLTFTSESIAGSADSAESTHLNVKNTSGASIAKGTPVYVTGSVGATDKLEIAPADASNASHMPAIGLLESTLANNGEGFAVQGGLLKGLVTDTIDGSASTANDTVYVKAGGGLTLTKPTGSTNFIQNIAKVARVHSSNGSLIVSSILRANDVPNLSTGKIWVGDSNTIESTVVHIDETNGRVGIGTTSPSSVIHIYKDAHPNAALAKFENPSGEAIVQLKSQNDTLGVIEFADSEDGNVGAIQYSHADNSMRFKTNDAEKMRIDSSGVVQVRNQTPTIQLYNTDTSLSLNQTLGDIDFYQSDASDQGVGTVAKIRAVNNSTFAGYGELAFHTGNATSIDERVRIDYQGNVGIGTDSPSYKISTRTTGTTSEVIAGFGNNNIEGGLQVITSDGSLEWGLNAINARSLVFQTNQTERMRIDSSGRVGIGVIPSNTLSIKGSVNQLDIETGSSGVTFESIDRADVNKQSDLSFYARYGNHKFFSGAYTEAMRIDSSSRVSIGSTSMNAGLRVATNGLQGYHAWFGASGFINNAAYHYDFAKVGFSVDDADGADTGAGFSFTTRNSGDSNWIHGYIYQPQNGGIAFGTGGAGNVSASERMRIDSNGETSVYNDFTIDNGSPEMYFKTGATHYRWMIAAQENVDAAFEITPSTTVGGGTYSTPVAVFKATGNVGIGTTSPSSDISGSATVLEIEDSNIASLALNHGTTGKFEVAASGLGLYFGHNGANKMVIQSGGNVGIGTTSPSQKLTVVGNAYIAGGLLLLDDNQPIQWGNSQQKIIGNNSGYLQFITSNSEAMRIDSSGRIGIGMTPSNYSGYMLQVNGGTQSFMSFGNSTTGTGALNGLVIGNDSTGADIYQREAQPIRFHTSNIERMRIVSGGGIQIPNVNATNEIQFTGSEYTNVYSATTAGFDIGTNSTNGTSYLRLLTENTERLRIDSSGRVGIGTTNPGVALDVVGAIRATGDVTAFHSSDERLKANKKIIENAADKIEQIGGYEFDWLPKEGVHINEGHDIGVIAQEVEKVIPEVVVTRDNGYKAVKYEKLVPLLIEAVKELSEKVKILENK